MRLLDRAVGWYILFIYLYIVLKAGWVISLVPLLSLLPIYFCFFSPFLLRVVIKNGVRISVIGSFCTAALAFGLAWILADHAWWTFATLFMGSCALIMLDVCGSLPFLMAVKPSERTEMSAVYSSFQSVSGILVPAAASIILLVSPIPGIFAVTSLSLGSMAFLARKLHSRLGSAK